MTLLLFYIALALGVSFVCSVMEAVLLSVTPSYTAKLERERERMGRRLKALKEDVDKPLSAILSLNTIAHTVGAAGAGAQAAFVFGDAYVGVISAVLTFLILVLSEIIPKTLGAVYWRNLAPSVVHILTPTILLMWPLVKLSKLITNVIARGKCERMVRREEFIALAEMGAREGVFLEQESRILRNLFRLHQIQVKNIMTPRTVIFALPESLIVEEAIRKYPEIQFSRIPVFADSLDDVKGFVLKSDLLLTAAQKMGNKKISELKRPIPLIPGNMSLPVLLERLMNERSQVAMAIDEYGGTLGVVTIEDLIETLLGMEIIDEADKVEDMQDLARKQWILRAKRMGIVTDEADLDKLCL